jgi:hydroxymethylglutaryl-CoA reductase
VDLQLLRESINDELELADTLIENAVGYFQLPFAVAPGITINGKLHPLIPLVIEETSVVAGLCKSILFTNSHGIISASQSGDGFIGQIHFHDLKNVENFERSILACKDYLITKANHGPCENMARRGGGVKDITVRLITRNDGKTMGVIHVMVETKDAMGANIINQTCEYLKPMVEAASGEQALLCILSNYNTEKITKIEITIEGIDETLAKRIEAASIVAQFDHYRAVTHNKGIMNGMDAICLATGNDWRALEAGMHGFAARDKQYQGLSNWLAKGKQLKGILEGPINIGTVGGVTNIHPLAALALGCLKVESSTELAYVIGAIGLIQNFAALRALVTDGIAKGHMRLHLKNLLKQTNATALEQKEALKLLEKIFDTKHYVSANDAHSVLKELRS